MMRHSEYRPTMALLVEDNPGDVRLIREHLRGVGTVGIGFEHVDRLDAALERLALGGIDAVLLDLGLPDSEGMETFTAIRNGAPDVPVIVISGLDDQERALHAVAAGAQDYLVKGRFDGAVLARVIQYAVQRKRAERALHQSYDRFRALVENGNDGIAVFDAAGVMIYCSPSTQRILGYDPDSLVGRSGLEYVKETDRAAVATLLANAHANPGEGAVGRALLRHANGSWRLIETTITNMLESPAVRGIVFNYRDVTEQQQSADLVRWLSTAVDQGSTAVTMTDASGCIEYVNRRFSEDTGYGAHEVIGKTIGFNGRGNDDLYEAVSRSIRDGQPYRGEVPNRDKDGREYWTDLQISPVRDAEGRVIRFIAFQTDISDRRAMNEKLRETNARLAESAERFRLLSEVTFDGIAIIRDGVIVEANPGLRRLFGVDSDSAIVGRPWTDFVSADAGPDVNARLLSGGEGRHELLLVRPDGGLLTTEATIRRHSMNGHPVQIMAIRDLTDQRAVEERLRQAQKMEAVGQLAGGVAHDFNNILAAIMITAELALQDPAASGQLHEDIRSIHAAGRRGADITRQLLTFSRKQVTTPREVCLVKLLEEMQPMLDQLVMASTSIETRSNATSAVRADPIELEQIVLNLVVNARDAMPSGGVVIVETRDVQVAARTQDLGLTPGPYVLLSVTDTGVGIEESIRSKLFEPFFTTKPPGKGTGLGLSTVAGIVRSLDGAIRVHSVVGKGTTFEIFLPAITSAGDPEPEHHADEAARGRETILVVEDEIMVRTSIRRMLASLGYRVLEAKNGRDALLIRRRHPGPVHLVVTDIVMPEMTGPEMLQELRREEPGLPAVIISGYNDSVVDTKALPARTTFLPKPFKSHMLALKVREQIDQSFLEQPELDHGNLAAPAGSIA